MMGEGAGCCTCVREVSPEVVDTQGVGEGVGEGEGTVSVLEKYPLR